LKGVGEIDGPTRKRQMSHEAVEARSRTACPTEALWESVAAGTASHGSASTREVPWKAIRRYAPEYSI
jgi:hypothetical protein